MGGALFDEFRGVTDKADEVLGYSIKALCLEDPDDRLATTAYTQPAVYVVNALSWMKTLVDRRPPDVVAGHSLGEYNALLAAGVFSFETGLRLVQRRAALMQRAPEGTMMAVLGLGASRVQAVLREEGASGVDFANDNAPEQVVLAGPRGELQTLVEPLTRAGASGCVMLNVGGAFHSRAMAAAARELARALDQVELAPPRIPVIANATGEPYPGDEVRTVLAQQMRSTVHWRQSMARLRQMGVTDAVEVGPGRVLANLYRANMTAPTPVTGVASAPPPAAVPTAAFDAGSAPPAAATFTAASLGSESFRRAYGVRYAYVAGSMYRGIASPALVVRMGRAGLIGYLGSGGLRLRLLDEAIGEIQRALDRAQAFGVNLLHHPNDPALESETAALLLRRDVRNVEAAAYIGMTEALAQFRFSGAYRDAGGRAVAVRRVIGKASRPEVAQAFMSPPPDRLLRGLVDAGRLMASEADAARDLPMCTDLCVEADSGGHTDGGVASVLVPSMRRLRDDMMRTHAFATPIRLGAAGGIGSPEAAAAAFLLGADFVLTGSINQCTPEAGTSDVVKDLLQRLDVQDTTYAPAGDMFELGATVQVVKKGVLFPARANRLYEIYRQHDSIDAIDPQVRDLLERRYFRRRLDEVWEDTQRYYRQKRPDEIGRAERNPKHKMALIFRWYFAHTTRLAAAGDASQLADFQVHCGPAMGAFNRLVRGTELEDWRTRHVDAIADRIMHGAAEVMTDFYARGFAAGDGAGDEASAVLAVGAR
jgi:trans-AT polyketide synthase/acyltransferase/oxidoreductase domain-containing protein